MTWLALLMLAASPDEPAAIEWMDDLDAACRKARAEGKLVLYRQILCACSGKGCPYEEMGRRPGYLDDPEARRAVAGSCVAAAVRVKPEQDRAGLKDPGYGALLRKGAPLQSFLLTPDRYILHRLDLCSWSGDLAGEIDYALEVRAICFDASGTLEDSAAGSVPNLLRDHRDRPKGSHFTRGGAPASECRCPLPRRGEAGGWKPWPDYNRGIVWHTELDEARRLARHTGRNLLFFQVVGDLTKEGC